MAADVFIVMFVLTCWVPSFKPKLTASTILSPRKSNVVVSKRLQWLMYFTYVSRESIIDSILSHRDSFEKESLWNW